MFSVVIPVSPLQFTSFYYDIVHIPKHSFVCCVCLVVLYFASWGVTGVTHAACMQILPSPLIIVYMKWIQLCSSTFCTAKRTLYSWWFENRQPPSSILVLLLPPPGFSFTFFSLPTFFLSHLSINIRAWSHGLKIVAVAMEYTHLYEAQLSTAIPWWVT